MNLFGCLAYMQRNREILINTYSFAYLVLLHSYNLLENYQYFTNIVHCIDGMIRESLFTIPFFISVCFKSEPRLPLKLIFC